ncbi:MAG: hypothetical protein HC847_11585 [Hydrococcus sp. RU_2_2]|nr:hypothetical protein [Hydrococcus sp. RU_2_2]
MFERRLNISDLKHWFLIPDCPLKETHSMTVVTRDRDRDRITLKNNETSIEKNFN